MKIGGVSVETSEWSKKILWEHNRRLSVERKNRAVKDLERKSPKGSFTTRTGRAVGFFFSFAK